MSKTLCEWRKGEIHDRLDEIAAIVRDPRFVCRKCARAAHCDKYLCKPTALPVAEHKHERVSSYLVS